VTPDELTASLRLAKCAETNRLTIAAQRLLANHVLPGVIADYMIEHPAARVVLHSETQENMWELICSGTADMALPSVAAGKGMRSELAGHLELKFMAVAQHPLAARSSIDISELPNYGFVGGLPSRPWKPSGSSGAAS
jgi:DNA-binding transcriptional LysR family regulator